MSSSPNNGLNQLDFNKPTEPWYVEATEQRSAIYRKYDRRMDQHWLDAVRGGFQRVGAELHPGLLEGEVRAIEEASATPLPEDLRTLLMDFVPAGPKFPDWRQRTIITEFMTWVADGIWFDMEHDGFWLQEWGSKPDRLTGKDRRVLEEALESAPRLAPLHIHRCMPCRPSTAGNPVLSVMQTDVIYYGSDIVDYLNREAGIHQGDSHQGLESVRRIPFWTEAFLE